MAAPSVTAKALRIPGPLAAKLTDGYQTEIVFARNPTVRFFEKTIKPPGFDGGEKIDITTMFNNEYRTFAPRSLLTVTEVTVNAAYDPAIYNDAFELINAPGSITVHFPDTSSVSFFGYLQKIDPAEVKEGEMPMLAATICPTNYDPVNRVEAAPVLTNVTGT